MSRQYRTSRFRVVTSILAMLAACTTAQAWRARTVLEYQNIRIVRVLEAESIMGSGQSALEDRLAVGGKAVELSAEGSSLVTDLKLEAGTYGIWVYGRVPKATHDGPWPPVFMEMTVKHPGGQEVPSRIQIAYQPTYQAVAQLYLIAQEAGQYSISLSVGTDSENVLRVDRLEIRDVLDGCRLKATKRGRYLVDDGTLQRIRAKAAEAGKKKQVAIKHVLPQDAMAKDIAQYAATVWERLPPINAMLQKEQSQAIGGLIKELEQRSSEYERFGDAVSAREAAVLLAALAHRYPTFDLRVQSLSYITARTRYSRFDQAVGHPYPPMALPRAYDRIFERIRKDKELAAGIGLQVKSVRSPKDLRAFFDCNVLQYELATCFRFTRRCRLLGWESWALTSILTLGPNSIGQQWMDRIFRQTYADLTGDGGYSDYMVNWITRDGCNLDGAGNYTKGVPYSLAKCVLMLERFVALGGKVPPFAYDPTVNPRLLQAGFFTLNFRSAGGFETLFGDGGGSTDFRFDNIAKGGGGGTSQAHAWLHRHTGDPRHAWWARAYPRDMSIDDDEWARLEVVAKTVTKDPVLHAPSITMPAYGCTLLEVGADADDPRHKGGAVLRHGTGRAHQHGDLLDLTLNAFNRRIITDGGRSGWPWMRFTAQHNTVEVDRHSFQSTGINGGPFGYPLLMRQCGAARFASAGGWCSTHPELEDYRRDVAMIDMGVQGEGEDRVRHFYVFDAIRVGGGRVHTYCSHGMPSDITFNVKNQPAKNGPVSLLYGATNAITGSTADPLITTWTAAKRTRDPKDRKKLIWESMDYGLRHHLFGWGNRKFYSAKGTHQYYNGNIPFLWIERESATPIHDTYASVFEPFWKEANLTTVRPLSVKGGGGGTDATRAVRVETRFGRTDTIVIGDGSAVQVEGGLETDAHFAFLTKDKQGLVQASMVGGTYLKQGPLKLAAATAAYQGTVKAMDVGTEAIELDPAPPAEHVDGELVSFGDTPHKSAEYIKVNGGKLRLARGVEIFRSPILKVDETAGAIYPQIAMPMTAAEPKSYYGTYASNERHDRWWRVDRTEVVEMWIPILSPISEADITDENGDGKRTVRLTNFAPPEKTRDPVVLFYGPFQKPNRMKQTNREPFKEPVILEVIGVDEERRMLRFKPPADYDLTWVGWVYAGTTIANEAGTRQWYGSVPAREFRIILSGDQPVRDKDFTDTDSPAGTRRDGIRRIHLYEFGPGAPYRLETHVTLRRTDKGPYALDANVKADAEISGKVVNNPAQRTGH